MKTDSVLCPDCGERIHFRHYTRVIDVEPCACMTTGGTPAEIRASWNGHLAKLRERWPGLVPDGIEMPVPVEDPWL